MEKQTSSDSLIGDRFLNQNAAIEYLKCGRTKFYGLRKQYQIPHYRHGGVLFFAKADLDAYFLSQKATLPK